MEIKEYLKSHNITLEAKIDEYLSHVSYPPVIAEGMKYAVLNGGKRIRPNLVFMTLDLFSKDINLGMPSAAAIEMIHSYSLVHDDLPAMDNDDYRRGKLTTHKKYGEAQGILIGDALLTYAFYVLTFFNQGLVDDSQAVKIIRLVSDRAGISGMIGGQIIDLESEGKKIDFETLKHLHENKTGQLIKLPVEVGCVIAGASDNERAALVKYAELIGLAFQIKDDILDIEGDFETIGKPVGSDIESEKSTYPSILGMDESKKLLHDTIEESKSVILANFTDKDTSTFISLADYIRDRDK